MISGFETFIPTLPEDIWLASDPKHHYQAFCREKNHGYPTDQITEWILNRNGLPTWSSPESPDIPLEESLERYTSDRAVEFLGRSHDKSFFLNASFDRPHHPLTPSGSYAGLYSADDIPLGRIYTDRELEKFPIHLRNYLLHHSRMFHQAASAT